MSSIWVSFGDFGRFEGFGELSELWKEGWGKESGEIVAAHESVEKSCLITSWRKILAIDESDGGAKESKVSWFAEEEESLKKSWMKKG
jgi:hypothetical protein